MIKRKKKIVICHEEENIRNFDVRENIPVWRNVRDLFIQFKDNLSKLKFGNMVDYNLSKLYTFYFKKIVEHYDPQVPEFTYLPLCSIIESIGKLKFPRLRSNKLRFIKAVKQYFDTNYTQDPDFIRSIKKTYENERNPFTHEVRRLGLNAQVGSQAQISSFIKDQNGNYIIGAKHLFHIAVEVVNNYFEEISVP